MLTKSRAARWGDNDQHLGPFTYGISDYRPWAMVLTSSGDGQDNDRACQLRINLRAFYLIVVLPNIVKPHMTKVYPKWDAATVERLGRDYYWDIDPRSYGFSINDGHFNIYYGRTGGSSCDSSIEQRWSCFLPWTQWREAYQAAKDACPTVSFSIEDFDGEKIVATTMIEEREWHFGTGWFKWLSWFCRPKIRRSLDIRFSGETGPEKGSWKGGTIGTGIDMLPGEDHEAAFRRYCDEQHRSKYRQYSVKFLSLVPPSESAP